MDDIFSHEQRSLLFFFSLWDEEENREKEK